LRIISGLSAGVEIDFINTGLPLGPRLSVPGVPAQLHLAEFLYSQASPYTLAFHGQRLGTVTTSSKLIAEDV
jgi:hypothetical protein